MDAKLKADWVKALRSGTYQQTTGALERRHGSNCCLGVLLKIQGVDMTDWDLDKRETSVLPPEYRGDLALDEMLRIAHRNDGTCGQPKHSFPEIADYIESNL